MFDESDSGVIIADGRCGVRLIRVGDPNELGCPTQIDVQAGPFVGSVRDDTVGPYSRFDKQLIALYDQLSGTATLTGYEGFSLVLTGDGRGAINVSVEVVGEHAPLIKLVFEYVLDQSFLPRIIRGISEFPDGVLPRTT